MSGTTVALPGQCCIMKSYDCNALGHRANILLVCCMTCNYRHASWSVTQVRSASQVRSGITGEKLHVEVRYYFYFAFLFLCPANPTISLIASAHVSGEALRKMGKAWDWGQRRELCKVCERLVSCRSPLFHQRLVAANHSSREKYERFRHCI